jgi:hypothetical protein
MIALSLHVLAAVFWAGSTFVLARTAGAGGDRLFRPQMGAAAVAVATGAYLWLTVHEGAAGPTEHFLGAGAAAALVAVAVQAVVCGGALGRLRRGDEAAARSRMAIAHRVAAILLAVATAAMAAARYA